jgi:hypothetical protein
MKSALGWLLALGIIAGIGIMSYRHFQDTARKQSYELALSELKHDFQRQATGLHQLSPEAYRKEVGILLTRYFSELGKLARDYPEQYQVNREIALGEAEVARGRLSEEQKAARDERIRLTLDLFDKMRSGHYQPIYTATDKGFRFDVYDITTATIDGADRVKIAYVHWGAFGPVEYKSIKGTMQTATAELAKSKKPSAEIPQIVGEQQPPSLQIDPVRWVSEFIPGVEIGYYDLPKFPHQATSVQLGFDFGIRTVGGSEVVASLQFPAVPILDTWKLPSGESWGAEELLVDEAELKAAEAQAKNQ